MSMSVTDQVNIVFDDLFQTYKEAITTYNADIALSGLAYMAAMAVHTLEHDARLVTFGPNAPALATGVWTDSFSKFLLALREACAEAQARGIN